MTISIRIPLLVLGTLLATAAHAGRYDYFECIAADGSVTYSVDRCSKGNTQRLVRDDAPPESTAPSPAAQRSAPVSSAGRSVPQRKAGIASGERLVVYTRSTCGYCRQAKQYMGAHGIGYAEVDIDRSASDMADYKRLGGRGVPFFVAGGRTMVGFSPEGLRDLLGL